MLTIELRHQREQLLAYCQKRKRVYHPGYYLYEARDSGETLAWGLFEIQGDHVEIIAFESQLPEDHDLFDGVLRAGFHYAGQQGIPHGRIPETVRTQFKMSFGQLNYPATPEFSIDNFFTKYKNCRA